MKKKLLFIVSISILIIGCNEFDKYTYVKTDTALKYRVNTHINSRGGSIINKAYLFDSSCPLITENSALKNKEFYFATFKVPYWLIKKKGEDKFYVIKNKDTFQYKLLKIKTEK